MEGVGLIPKDEARRDLLMCDSMRPRTIEEGKSEAYFVDHQTLENQGVRPDQIAQVVVRDQTGRVWKKDPSRREVASVERTEASSSPRLRQRLCKRKLASGHQLTRRAPSRATGRCKSLNAPGISACGSGAREIGESGKLPPERQIDEP